MQESAKVQIHSDPCTIPLVDENRYYTAHIFFFENSAGELLDILIEEDLAQLIRETGPKNHTEWPSL
jgi:hypothetical protein